MNRHNQKFNFQNTDEEVISSIYREMNGEWMANGEYMNKSKIISTIKYSIINL
jgi:hypothetical protein